MGAGGQYIVGVQLDAVPQGPLSPIEQGITGGYVGIAIHWPPQDVGVGGQYIVGVQLDAVPQGLLSPIEQGITGGNVSTAMH